MSFQADLKRIVDDCQPGLIGGTTNPSVNLINSMKRIKGNPRLLTEFQAEANSTLTRMQFVRALTRAGLANESGFFREVFKRVEYTILPRAHDQNDALGLIGWLFSSGRSQDWVEYIDEEVLANFMDMMITDRLGFVGHVAPQLFESLEILCLMLSQYGVHERISDRLESRTDLKDAFFKVQRIFPKFIDTQSPEMIEELEKCLDKCEEAAEFIRGERHEKGISLDLTYQLIRIADICSRMRMILNILKALYGGGDHLPIATLVKAILISETRRLQLGPYLSKNISLLAYEITQHTGRTGEHYITNNRTEYRAMFQSAMIGGAIVGFLAILKTAASMVGFPLFFEAFIFSSIYAIGFLVIINVGGVIATKQPAMTASRIAAALDQDMNTSDSMANVCEMVIKTIRSQLVAVVGNYAFAFPVAVVICWIMIALGVPLISQDKAHHMIEAQHPFLSLSFFYAAVAGVGLFFSGILAGMANNWFIFNRIGARLKNSRLINLIADRNDVDAGVEHVSENIGNWVGNVSLGIYLGSMSTIGAIFGLPLDTRHITFSSAQAGIAFTHLGFQQSIGFVCMIMATVFMMGLINLGVSFSLAMFLAIKSRGVRFLRTAELFRLLGKRFIQRPQDFFFAPKDSEPGKSNH